MEFKWRLDEELQINAYLAQAKQIQSGFFQRIRAVVVPFYNPEVWFFPDYKLFQNPEFVVLLENYSYNAFITTNSDLTNCVREKFDLYVSNNEIEVHKEEFEKLKDKLITFFSSVFPISDKVKTINIIPVKFGTFGSFYQVINNDNTYDFYITYRIDKGIPALIKSIASRFVTSESNLNQDSLHSWSKRQAICDFFYENTLLKEFVGKNELKGTLDYLNDYKGNLYKESVDYFAEMKFPIKSCFVYTDNTIFYNDMPLIRLSNKEITIMKFLIDKKSQIVSFDEIGKAYWDKDSNEKFSLYSIAKIIEKLRKKLIENNVPTNYIVTVRKRGYMLYD